jgi:hypothetical protein
LQQLSESFQNFLFGSTTPTPKSPKASTEENPTTTQQSQPSSTTPSNVSSPDLSSSVSSSVYHTPASVITTSPRNSVPFLQLNNLKQPMYVFNDWGVAVWDGAQGREDVAKGCWWEDEGRVEWVNLILARDEQTIKLREKALYDTEKMKHTLEEQLRQMDIKLSANTGTGTDDPISQIKVSN